MSSNSSSPNLIEIIDKAKKKFVEIAPPEIKFEAEARFALALISNNSHLRQVATEHPGSFRESVLQVATIGLTLNPAEKLAYLITRNIKVAPNRWELMKFL